jgi:hypothetical protein
VGRLRGVMWANWVTVPPGETWTIVVPVPWKLPALLKLLTRTLPLCNIPALCLTTATPYGLTSPLAGTVDGPWLFVGNLPMNELCPEARAGPATSPPPTTAAAAVATTARVARLIPRMRVSPSERIHLAAQH